MLLRRRKPSRGFDRKIEREEVLCCENLGTDEEIYIHVESVYWGSLEGHEKCNGGFLIYLNFKRCQMLKSF